MARGGVPLVHDEIFVSYAQNFEDVMLWRALGHVERGFYIDVGAQHPRIDSVSRAFYERDWRGVHVEPADEYARLLREDRPDEDVLQAAIAERDGLVEYFEIAQTGLSTIDSGIAAGHADAGYAPQRRLVPCMTLDRLLAPYADRDVHWLKIDVEGAERRVLQGWTETSARPWIVVVESTRPLTAQTTVAEWEPDLVALGYEHAYFDGLNSFYVSLAHPELRQAFACPPNVFDDFELSGLSSFGLGWQRRTHELEAAHAAALASANAAIASLEQREAALQLDVRQAQTRIAERDARIALLQAWLDERGAERDRLWHALDAMREERNRQVAGLEARLHEHAARYTALEAFSRQVEALYASVIASRSWRLTRPLRWIADGCRRWARVAHAKARPATEAPRRRLRAVLRRGIAYVEANPRRKRAVARVVRPIRPLDAWLRSVAARHAAAPATANATGPGSSGVRVEYDGGAQLLARRLEYITELETRIDRMALAHHREVERLQREVATLRRQDDAAERASDSPSTQMPAPRPRLTVGNGDGA